MDMLIDIKGRVIDFYSRFEAYIKPALKFIISLVTLLLINGRLGFMSKIDNILIVLMVALLCSFLPSNLIVLFAAVFIMLHMYELSLQLAVVVGLVFVIMFILYFRFTPGESVAVLLMPICCALKIPYLIPIAVGFVGGPLSCVSVCCGAVAYYMVSFIGGNPDLFSDKIVGAESALTSFKSTIDAVLKNDTMILVAVVCTLMALVVSIIRRLSFDYSWYVALGMSTLIGIITLLIGKGALDADISVGGSIISIIVCAALNVLFILIIHNLDYASSEFVQFEDDDYYYYVKAIPKLESGRGRRSGRRG